MRRKRIRLIRRSKRKGRKEYCKGECIDSCKVEGNIAVRSDTNSAC
jgi:hypothetical protein